MNRPTVDGSTDPGPDKGLASQGILLKQYLAGALQSEKACLQDIRSFEAAVDDDEEVAELFERLAQKHELRAGSLDSRLRGLGGEDARDAVFTLPTVAPNFFQSGDAIEESLLQNLVSAYSGECAICGLYELLASVSKLSRDPATETLARQAQQDCMSDMHDIYQLIPSRSKIAFNMLTLTEADPSVETKLSTDRLGN